MTAAVTPASKEIGQIPEAKAAWQLVLPDRAVAMQVTDKSEVVVHTADGSVTTIAANGKVVAQKVEEGFTAPPVKLPDNKPPRCPATSSSASPPPTTAPRSAYWGGALQILDATGTMKSSQQFPDDITEIAWLGDKLIVGLSDRTLVALQSR